MQKRRWILPAAALLLCFLAYMQALGYEFVYDDVPLIVENPAIRDIRNIPSMFMEEDIVDEVKTGYYRPVIPLIDAINYQLWGASSAGFHLASVLYHLAAVGLVFFLSLRLLGDPASAFVASLFFGLHPVNTEAVTFISGKNNVICAIFILSSFLGFLKYRDGGRPIWLVFSTAFFFMGLLSKEFAVMLPFLMLASERMKGKLRGKDLAAYAPYAAAASVYLLLRGIVLQGMVGKSLQLDTMGSRLLGMADVLFVYIRLVFVPLGQKALYGADLTPSAGTVLSALVLGGVLWAVLRWRSKFWVSFSALWFFIFLLPVSNIVPVSGAAMAERYLYVSLAGAGVFVGGVYRALPWRRSAGAVFAAFLVALAVLTVLRNPVWRDDGSLYADMIKTTPASYKGYYNLGNMMYRQGKYDEAARLWNKALEVKPDMFAVHNNLGVIYEKSGDYALAEKHFRAVLSVRTMPEVYVNLGNVLKEQGRDEEAGEAYRRAIRLSYNDLTAYMRLSELYEAEGRYDEAVSVLEEAAEKAPDAYLAYNRAGSILAENGRYKEAGGYFRKALDLNAGCYECRYNLELLEKIKAKE